MRLACLSFLLLLAGPVVALAQAPASAPVDAAAASAATPLSPKARADVQKYLEVVYRYSPETASADGVTKSDGKIADVSLAAERSKVKEEQKALEKVAQATEKESDPAVKLELSAYLQAQQAALKAEAEALDHEVVYIDAAAYVSRGLLPLLGPGTSGSRHVAANERMKRYTGIDPDPQGNSTLREGASIGRSTAPMTGVSQGMASDNSLVSALIQRLTQQMRMPGVVYPARADIERQMAKNNDLINQLIALFRQDKVSNWEPAFAALERGLVFYDDWVKQNLLPHAR